MGVKQKSGTLNRRSSALSDSMYQLKVLNEAEIKGQKLPVFIDRIQEAGFSSLRPDRLEILQINIGKLCNQTCAHCHVDAGPDRKKENMNRQTLEKCLEIILRHNITKVDITGGAPEMNPHFRWFVASCAEAGVHIINRCNLTVIESHPRFGDLPEFFAKHKVEVVSSLPYFTRIRTDSQRGDGVFEDSIKALKKLNEAGYGQEGSGLILNLVFNPSGAFLPGNQASLEAEFKRQLGRRYNITFNNLYAITNLPISRFLDYLLDSGNYLSYMTELVEAFNPVTIQGLMCRNTLSVSWDGYIYDCDFNQMLDMKVSGAMHIDNFDMNILAEREIAVNQHCYGCTAGAGSSCGGEIVQ